MRLLSFFGLLQYTIALNTVLLSRWSALNCPEFYSQLQVSILHGPTRHLTYVGTASSHYREDIPHCRGEQQRRARYDARKKMKELQSAFGAEEAVLLELHKETTAESIRHALSRCSLLYVDGGNTFYLQKIFNELNFWDIAIPTLEKVNAVYFGASAGAICTGRSIATALFKGWDDPRASGAIDKDYIWDDVTYKGPSINDIGASLHYFPHFVAEDGHDALIQEKMHAGLVAPGSKVVAIANDEAILSVDGTEGLSCWSSGSCSFRPLRVYSAP